MELFRPEIIDMLRRLFSHFFSRTSDGDNALFDIGNDVGAQTNETPVPDTDIFAHLHSGTDITFRADADRPGNRDIGTDAAIVANGAVVGDDRIGQDDAMTSDLNSATHDNVRHEKGIVSDDGIRSYYYRRVDDSCKTCFLDWQAFDD